MRYRSFNPLFNTLILIFCLSFFITPFCFAEEAATPSNYVWKKPKLDPSDLVSLQRGMRLFMDHCSGCHSLQYIRYKGVAKDIGIVDQKGKVLENIVKDDLAFNTDKITDPIKSSMRKQDAANWFGIAPPDLTLEVRAKGADWVYNYLLSFYPDPKKLWGVNNSVYPDAAMPDVLENLRSQMKPEEFEKSVNDIVNFLNFVAEPVQEKRKAIGVWVLVFLGIFTIFAALLKREYWKDVK